MRIAPPRALGGASLSKRVSPALASGCGRAMPGSGGRFSTPLEDPGRYRAHAVLFCRRKPAPSAEGFDGRAAAVSISGQAVVGCGSALAARWVQAIVTRPSANVPAFILLVQQRVRAATGRGFPAHKALRKRDCLRARRYPQPSDGRTSPRYGPAASVSARRPRV